MTEIEVEDIPMQHDRVITTIAVHRYLPEVTIEALRKNHKQKTLVRLGYHYVITPDGVLHDERPDGWGGWFDKDIESEAVGIALVGEASNEQMETLETVEVFLANHYQVQRVLRSDKLRELR